MLLYYTEIIGLTKQYPDNQILQSSHNSVAVQYQVL